MVMDAAKTHNSTPPPGGGWVEAREGEGNEITRSEGRGSCRRRSRSRRRTTTITEELVPPDGGWGWVIVLANCINTSVLNSIVPCFGVMYLPLVALGYSNSQVATLASLFLGFTNILGPVSTGLSHYYSSRRITLVGFTIIVLGLFLCSFYKNIIWFYIWFGVVAGIGSALAAPQGFLLGQKYFCHKRVTANGLSTLGASLGGMFFPPLTNYLVETYSVEGAFLLWAGILLHGLIGGSLLQPVAWHMKPKPVTPLDTAPLQQNGAHAKNEIPSSKIVVAEKVEDKKENSVIEDESVVKYFIDDSDDSDHEEVMSQEVFIDDQNLKKNASDDQCSARKWKNPLTDVLQTNEYLERPRTVSIERSMEILPQIPEESEDEDCFETYDPESGNELVEFLNRENELRNRPVSYISTKSVDSIANIDTVESMYGSCDVVNQFGSALSFKVEKMKDNAQAIDRKNRRSSSVGTQSFKPIVLCGLKIPRLQHIINFTILRHPVFIIAVLGSVFNRLVYYCLMTYLPTHAHELGISKKAPYLITIIGAFEMVGKVIISAIADQDWLQRRYILIMVCTSSGLSILGSTLAWDLASLGACCAIYGFSVGSIMSVGPVLLVEYLGLKLLPHSFGMMLFMNGISGFLILPVTGWLTDMTGNFIFTFYIIGCLSLMAGVLWSLVPCFSKAVGEASKASPECV